MLIKRVVLLTILCFQLNQFTFGQDKELTLEEAIVKQRTELAPESIKQLDWVKGKDKYSFIEGEGSAQKLMTAEVSKEATSAITLKSLNGMLKAAGKEQMKSFPSIKWISENEFLFSQENAYFIANLKTDKLVSLDNESENVSHFEFEPNFRHLAYTSGNNLKIKLFNSKTLEVTTEKDSDIVCGQAVHRFEFGISKGIFWSPKGHYLAFYRNDQGEVTNYPLVNTEAKPARLKNIKYPMAGMKNEKVKVGIYNPETEETIYLETEKGFEYLTNIAWGPDEKYIYVAQLNRDQNHMKLNRFDALTGKFVKTLFEEKHDKYVEPLHPMIFLNEPEQEFLWLSRRSGFMHIYHYDGEGMLINQLTKGNWLVNRVLGLNDKKTKIFVEGTGENPTEMYIYSVDIKSAGYDKIPGATGSHKGKISSSGNYLIDEYSSIKVPGVINIIDAKGNISKNLLKAANPLTAYKMGEAELFTIEGEGSTPLYCRMIKPTDFSEDKKYPVVVYVYNGPHVQLVRNTWLGGAPLWMYHLAEKGYLVFTLDGRGSSNRGAAFEQATFRQLGTLEMEDQLKGVEYLKSRKYVDQERMAVHGWSYGGFMTTSLMLRKPGTFKVGVAGGPVIDWKFYEIMYTERYMDTPEQNPEGFEKSSLLNYAGQLQGKLLLIHGMMDNVVVPQNNLAFIRKCVESGVQVDFFPYPTHPHNVRGKDRVHLMQKVINYIEEKL